MNPTVLIVDDHPINLKLLVFALKSRGYTIETANDAVQARAVLATVKPALILMDLQMPGVSGFELTRELKLSPATLDIPIVAVTAFAMRGDEDRARAAGCDGYLTKPVDLQALRALVQQLIGDGGGP
jgi:two-component system cell cycle response regulator DivK